jgi:hypothetical protein
VAERAISSFPCIYLGLPLSIKKPPKSAIQPYVQKIANRLPGWKKNHMSYPGRELLVKTVLSAMVTYFITAFKPHKWMIHAIDKFRRAFL